MRDYLGENNIIIFVMCFFFLRNIIKFNRWYLRFLLGSKFICSIFVVYKRISNVGVMVIIFYGK